jgi:hypothetical protein
MYHFEYRVFVLLIRASVCEKHREISREENGTVFLVSFAISRDMPRLNELLNDHVRNVLNVSFGRSQN